MTRYAGGQISRMVMKDVGGIDFRIQTSLPKAPEVGVRCAGARRSIREKLRCA